MAANIRRVVTANDNEGKSEVWIDDLAQNVKVSRSGVTGTVVWTTDTVPPDLSGAEDLGDKEVERPPVRRGTIFRIIEFQPGNTTDMHVTQTIDYAIVLKGEIDMRLEKGAVHLVAGDVIVQRGTLHDWVNTGDEVCVIAFILIDAHE
jgi:quercetin dioxygenase-like cupin family protein|tara:strand:- start:4800 stop:5243 length:444 start_codon:yes stop_codon:yes gene_type:complete